MTARRPASAATPGRVKRVRRDEVRSRLLEAALAVFEEKGYEGASLERVSEAAGFSKGAVYSNFANKDELFFELVSSRIDARIEAIRSVGEGRAASVRGAGGKAGRSGADLARLVGKLLRELGEADPAWQELFIEFWLRCARNEELRAKLALKRRAMRARIAEAAESHASAAGIELGHARAMDLATTLLALSNGMGIEGRIDPEAVSPVLMGELLARILA